MIPEIYDSVIQDPESTINRSAKIVRRNWFSYLLFVPALLFLFGMIWVPFIRGFWMSLHIWPAFGEKDFVGLENYRFLLGGDVFWTSMKATLIYMSMTIIQLVLALGASLAARNLKRFENVINGIFLVPYTMPPVVTGTIWLYILNPNSGPMFDFLVDWGVLAAPIYWGSSGTTAITVITLVGSWTFWQFLYLIFIASLQNIPDEHYETAKVYGANRVQQFLRITLPQLKSALFIAISIRIVRNLVKVSQPIQMTQGGPGYETSVLAILLYRFILLRQDYGLAFAVGLVLFLVAIGLTFVFIRAFKQQERRAIQ